MTFSHIQGGRASSKSDFFACGPLAAHLWLRWQAEAVLNFWKVVWERHPLSFALQKAPSAGGTCFYFCCALHLTRILVQSGGLLQYLVCGIHCVCMGVRACACPW